MRDTRNIEDGIRDENILAGLLKTLSAGFRQTFFIFRISKVVICAGRNENGL